MYFQFKEKCKAFVTYNGSNIYTDIFGIFDTRYFDKGFINFLKKNPNYSEVEPVTKKVEVMQPVEAKTPEKKAEKGEIINI